MNSPLADSASLTTKENRCCCRDHSEVRACSTIMSSDPSTHIRSGGSPHMRKDFQGLLVPMWRPYLWGTGAGAGERCKRTQVYPLVSAHTCGHTRVWAFPGTRIRRKIFKNLRKTRKTEDMNLTLVWGFGADIKPHFNFVKWATGVTISPRLDTGFRVQTFGAMLKMTWY